MTDRPILFSGPMVRAILAGTKTETRRICKLALGEGGEPAGSVHPTGSGRSWIAWWPFATAAETARLYPGNEGFRCPYGVPSDRLWVREAFQWADEWLSGEVLDEPCAVLAVEAVRVERLHDIDDAGARAEGVADREAFRALWRDINGAESWDANPWVWVVGFSRVQP